jgi:putative membrane protein
MQRLITMALGLAVIGLGLAAPTLADEVKDKSDAKFILEAASGGMMEVKLGQLAAERAATADVRKFGERMVKDHTKANMELMAVAEKRGVMIPKEMNQKDQAEFDKIKDLKGAEFDRAYMKHMLKDHEHDVDAFAKFSKDGQDEQVKTFATKTLPTLKEHLKMAREICDKMGIKD